MCILCVLCVGKAYAFDHGDSLRIMSYNVHNCPGKRYYMPFESTVCAGGCNCIDSLY